MERDLWLDIPRDVKIVEFADGTLIIVASGKTSEGEEAILNNTLLLVVSEIKNIGIRVLKNVKTSVVKNLVKMKNKLFFRNFEN